MAIELLGQLRTLTFSPLDQPRHTGTVINNVLRFSIWGALGTGCVAGASTVFSKVVIERNTLTPPIFRASMISCATFTVFAAFLFYSAVRIYSVEPVGERNTLTNKFNADAVSLESRIGLTSGIPGIAAILAHHVLKTPSTIKTIAGYSVLPLICITTTMAAICLFHDYQRKKSDQLG
jgi:hypothetical protein